MAEEIKISKPLLGGLLGALALSLIGLAFLLGRQSAPSVAVAPPATPTPPPLAATQPNREATLDERLEQLEQRVDRVGPRTLRQAEVKQPDRSVREEWPPPARREVSRQAGAAQPAPEVVKSAPPAVAVRQPVSAERQDYFRKIDAITRETASIEDPNKFATEILQQSMSGEDSGMQTLLAATRKTKAALEGVTPPAECQEYHALLVGQISQSLTLLSEVQQALASNDTSRLTALAARGQEMQAQAQRFQELDARLRGGAAHQETQLRP